LSNKKDQIIETIAPESKYRLTIPKCNIQHEGDYRIIAKNSAGSSNLNCKLDIIEPIKIIENLSNIQAKEDESTTFILKTEKSIKSPFSNIEWFFNGNKINTDTKDLYDIENIEEELFSLHTLKIMRVKSLLHEGVYHARLKNHHDLLTATNKVKLDVTYQPKFIIKPEDQKIKLDSTPLQLAYKIESKPNAEITW
jgi:hypothetical protein